MKHFERLILLLIGLSVFTLESCNDDSDEPQIENITSEIEFTLSLGDEVYQSTEMPFLATIAIPISEDSESRIVNYAKSHSFGFFNQDITDIGIQLNYTVDIFNERLDLDSRFLAESKGNNIEYLIDQTAFLGFGVTIDLEMSDDSRWYSYQNYADFNGIDNVDQSNSEFDINEVIELDTATYIKARFNCNLYDELGNQISLNSGNLTFRLN